MPGNDGVDPEFDAVLDSLAVSGPDAASVTDYAMGVLASRARHQRLLGAGAAVVVLLGGSGLLALSGGEDPDEVVATGSSTTTSEPERSDVAADTTVTSAAPTTVSVPVTTAVPLTLPPGPTSTATLPPPSVAPTTRPTSTTTPPDQPGSGSLVLTPGAAGEAIEVRFDWSDPDGPGTPPVVTVSTDEPGDAAAQSAAGPGGSCTGGPGSNVSLRDSVQFASTGTRVVTVTVAHCSAPPQVFSGSVEISAPTFEGGPGRAVMAELPQVIESEPLWTLTRDDGTSYPLEPADPDITHPISSDGAFSLTGVVVVVPANVTGVLTYRPDGAGGSAYSGLLGPPAQGGPASHVRLTPEG